MKRNNTAKQIAFCGLITGFGVLVMLTGGLIPLLTYCAPVAASALLIPVLFEYGRVPALTVWLATSLAALLAGADKEAAFFYLFIGWYPVLKPRLDALPNKHLRLASKIAVFAVCVAALYSLLLLILQPASVMADFSDMTFWFTAGFCCALVFLLLVCDVAYTRFALVYLRKLRPKIARML